MVGHWLNNFLSGFLCKELHVDFANFIIIKINLLIFFAIFILLSPLFKFPSYILNLEMQRIQHLKESTCQKILLNTFFYPSTVPEFIEKFFLLLEFYAFTVFITADVVDNPLYPTA